MKTPKIIKEIVLSCNHDVTLFHRKIKEYAEFLEAKNRLASITNDDFVDAIALIASNISTMSFETFDEIFLSMCEETTELLANGQEKKEILSYFENKFIKMLEKERSRQ